MNSNEEGGAIYLFYIYEHIFEFLVYEYIEIYIRILCSLLEGDERTKTSSAAAAELKNSHFSTSEHRNRTSTSSSRAHMPPYTQFRVFEVHLMMRHLTSRVINTLSGGRVRVVPRMLSSSSGDAAPLDFSIGGKELAGRPIYLDFQATTPTDPRALDAMLPFLLGKYGNPHSKTHSFGWETEQAIEDARGSIADLIGASSKEIIFTSGKNTLHHFK